MRPSTRGSGFREKSFTAIMLSSSAIGCVADELALTESLGRDSARPSQTIEFRGLDSGDHDYRSNRHHDITRRENEGKKEG